MEQAKWFALATGRIVTFDEVNGRDSSIGTLMVEPSKAAVRS